ncbi:MAG: hypothetical protein QY318_01395 [Candidatus Dojkabacteria bacterium]|nr:MAG: hypothetical protein QY318_01395 [Candidatus Dojkabacteria bacterium]
MHDEFSYDTRTKSKISTKIADAVDGFLDQSSPLTDVISCIHQAAGVDSFRSAYLESMHSDAPDLEKLGAAIALLISYKPDYYEYDTGELNAIRALQHYVIWNYAVYSNSDSKIVPLEAIRAVIEPSFNPARSIPNELYKQVRKEHFIALQNYEQLLYLIGCIQKSLWHFLYEEPTK